MGTEAAADIVRVNPVEWQHRAGASPAGTDSRFVIDRKGSDCVLTLMIQPDF